MYAGLVILIQLSTSKTVVTPDTRISNPALDTILIQGRQQFAMVLSSVIRSAARVSRSSISQCCRRATYSTDNKGRYFTKKHEWVLVKDNIGTVGISEYAQDALGEVVFAQLPDVGAEVTAGDECGALESVKAASEVYTPVSGTITEKNVSVEKTPSLINKSSLEEGWLFKLKLSKPEEVNDLMDHKAYEKYLEESH